MCFQSTEFVAVMGKRLIVGLWLDSERHSLTPNYNPEFARIALQFVKFEFRPGFQYKIEVDMTLHEGRWQANAIYINGIYPNTPLPVSEDLPEDSSENSSGDSSEDSSEDSSDQPD